MKTVTFDSFISVSLTITKTEFPVNGHFVQWANSFIVENNTKIPLTVALVRTKDGTLILANPLGMYFHDN